MKNEILNFLHTHWPEISLLIYEIIARIVPTSKNLSLIDLILKVTGKGLELTQKGIDKVVPNNQKNTLKSFFLLALLFVGLSASAQLSFTGKQFKYRNSSNLSAADTTTRAQNGDTYFDETTQTLRLYKNGAWTTIGEGGGGITSADNGLSVSGTTVQLGGSLLNNRTFSGAFDIRFSNSTTTFNSQVLRINNPANTFNYRLDGGTIVANRVITFPAVTGDRFLMLSAVGLANGIPHQTGVNGEYNLTAGFTFTGTTFTTPNVVSTGRGTFTTTSTLAGLNIGSFAGDPSVLSNADLWYNSTTNNLRARINGTSFNWLTNSSATNELPKSDANGNLTTSGLFSTTNGNINLGSGSLSGTNRKIEAISSSANSDIIIAGQGSATIILDPQDVGAASGQISFSQTQMIAPTGTSTYIIQSNQNLRLQGADLELASVGGSGAANANDVEILAGNATGSGTGGDVAIFTGTSSTGRGGQLRISDGSNRNMGTATLVAGTVTVNNTTITANTRIFYSVQTAGGTQGFLRVASRVVGTSFTITSTSATETSTVAWLLVEPN